MTKIVMSGTIMEVAVIVIAVKVARLVECGSAVEPDSFGSRRFRQWRRRLDHRPHHPLRAADGRRRPFTDTISITLPPVTAGFDRSSFAISGPAGWSVAIDYSTGWSFGVASSARGSAAACSGIHTLTAATSTGHSPIVRPIYSSAVTITRSRRSGATSISIIDTAGMMTRLRLLLRLVLLAVVGRVSWMRF